MQLPRNGLWVPRNVSACVCAGRCTRRASLGPQLPGGVRGASAGPCPSKANTTPSRGNLEGVRPTLGTLMRTWCPSSEGQSGECGNSPEEEHVGDSKSCDCVKGGALPRGSCGVQLLTLRTTTNHGSSTTTRRHMPWPVNRRARGAHVHLPQSESVQVKFLVVMEKMRSFSVYIPRAGDLIH